MQALKRRCAVVVMLLTCSLVVSGKWPVIAGKELQLRQAY